MNNINVGNSRYHLLTRFLLLLASCVFSQANGAQESDLTEDSQQSKASVNVLIIEEITCLGNKNTKCDFIKKKYYQTAGDVLDPGKVSDARLRLGALKQFRDVSVHLEKGSERGRVVVVFSVIEANHIQYEFSLNYRYSRQLQEMQSLRIDPESLEIYWEPISIRSKTERYGLNGYATDFNFLGTGKQLSIGLNTGVIYIEDEINDADWNNSGLTATDKAASVLYYDPHLLGSRFYYLNAGYQETKITNKDKSGNYEFTTRDDYQRKYIELGRRFASHSYVSLAAAAQNTTDDINYSVTYGWDSEDDPILPTTGSVFTTIINNVSEDPACQLHYRKNIEVIGNKVLTVGGGGFYGDWMDRPIYALSSKFTSIKSRDAIHGKYSGWSIGFSVHESLATESDRKMYGSFSVGYVYQTDAMVLHFDVTYNTDKDSL